MSVSAVLEKGFYGYCGFIALSTLNGLYVGGRLARMYQADEPKLRKDIPRKIVSHATQIGFIRGVLAPLMVVLTPTEFISSFSWKAYYRYSVIVRHGKDKMIKIQSVPK